MDTLSPQTRRLFQHLRKRWLPEPDLQDGFLESLEGYASLQEHFARTRASIGSPARCMPT